MPTAYCVGRRLAQPPLKELLGKGLAHERRARYSAARLSAIVSIRDRRR
jgi:hypothetical protein